MKRKRYMQIAPDPKYNSVLVTKFANKVMWNGKKTVALRIIYDALDIISKRITDVPPLEVFETAINNVKPLLEVKSKRIGGATYQVPVEVEPARQQTLAIRWIVEAARAVKGKPMAEKLANELISAYRKEGAAIKKREDEHRMAEANKAFAHLR